MEEHANHSGALLEGSWGGHRLSDRTFRRLFEAAPGLYLVLNPDLLIVAVSDAYLHATRTRREDLLGRPLFEVMTDNPNDPHATGPRNLGASLRRVLASKAPDTMAVQKYAVRRPASEGGGFEERYWSPVNCPVLDDSGSVSFIIHRVEDVTEYVRLKEQRVEQRRATEELQSRADRMDAEIYCRAQEIQRVNEQLERRSRQLEILTTAAQEINSSLQVPDIMRRLVRLSLELVDASEGTWGRMIDGRMTFTEYLRREGQALEPHFIVFEREMGVPGHVMVTRQPYISNDAARDPHVLAHQQKAMGFYNLIDLPIFSRSGELLGCFELHNKRGHQPFTQEDLELLKGLRASAAVALENAQLYEAVQAERRTLDAIVRQMPAGLTLAEAPSGRLLYYNPEMERILGHPAPALEHHEQYAQAGAIHEDHSPYRADEYPLVRALLRGEIVQDEEMLYRRGDGRIVYLSVMAAPIRDAEGRITQAVSVFIDISARKAAEAALHDERMWLEALLDHLPVPLTLIDPSSGAVTFRNEEAKRLGFSIPTNLFQVEQDRYFATDAQGRRIPLHELPRFRAARGEAFAGVEMTWHSPEGSRPLIMNGGLMPALHGRAALAMMIFQDISELKRVEEALARSLSSEQVAREEAEMALTQLRLERDLREQFVSALSHDLRTPLTAAKMSAQLIPRQANLPDKVYSLAARVKQNIDRADQMITDLLDASRIRAGQGLPIVVAPCELREVVAGTLEDLSTVHGERFSLRGEGPIHGHWDADALRRLTENLCNNAIKYGEPTGRVTVTLSQNGDGVELAVHNRGRPIPEAEQARLFQHFGRAKSAEASGKKGWGIGLTLVKGVAEAHGGSVQVESTPEHGTTFRVRLPRHARPG